MIVEIPKVQQHQGYPGNLIKLKISDTCPVCGGNRGAESWRGRSYDGSRWLAVDNWTNACGHIDHYTAIRVEGTPVDYSEPSITEDQQEFILGDRVYKGSRAVAEGKYRHAIKSLDQNDIEQFGGTPSFQDWAVAILSEKVSQ